MQMPAMARPLICIFGIDAGSSYFIGDRERDVIAGEAAGVKGILIDSDQPIGEILNLIA
jgi:D-glycero-D-manno-heptose 1,7-bisphosphate phosphatase